MRIEIEAEPGELAEKAERLVGELSRLFKSNNPDLAELLEKALPPKEKIDKFPAMQELTEKMQKLYQKHLDKMLEEIFKVLERGIQKSEGYDFTEPILEREDRAYRRAKDVLLLLGYAETAFEEGGCFYGLSTNELLDIIKLERKSQTLAG